MWGGNTLSAKTIVLVVVALVLAIASVFLLPTGVPHVSVKAETLIEIAPGIPFTNSLTIMLITDVILILVALMATGKMAMVPRGMQNIMEATIDALYNIFAGVNREWIARGPTFAIVATIFLFVFVANILGLFPGVGSIGVCHSAEHGGGEVHARTFDERLAMVGQGHEWQAVGALAASEGGESAPPMVGCEAGQSIIPIFRTPSADLNFTFGLALLSFVYIEIVGFQALGPGYLGKFFNFHDFKNGFGMGVMGFLVGLLELISEFARILAFAFRLFGNIFAGEVVLVVLAFLVPLMLPLPFFFFEVFVAFIQAFVFAILTMAFIAIAVTPHGDGEHH